MRSDSVKWPLSLLVVVALASGIGSLAAFAQKAQHDIVWAPIGPERTSEEVSAVSEFVKTFMDNQAKPSDLGVFIYCTDCLAGDPPTGNNPPLPIPPLQLSEDCWQPIGSSIWMLEANEECTAQYEEVSRAGAIAKFENGPNSANSNTGLVISWTRDFTMQVGDPAADPAATENFYIPRSPIRKSNISPDNSWFGWTPQDKCAVALMDVLNNVISDLPNSDELEKQYEICSAQGQIKDGDAVDFEPAWKTKMISVENHLLRLDVE